MTTSEANKIRKQMLASSDAVKANICRMLLETTHSYTLKEYPEKHLAQFCEQVSAKDFAGAIQILHDKMLPALKKKSQRDYYSELLSINCEITLTYDFQPRYKEILDEGLAQSNYYGILKFLNKMISSSTPHRYLGDMLYVMEEILRRPLSDIPPYTKHCMFHLFAKMMARRDGGKLAKLCLKPYFYYFQIKYQCFDETNPLEQALYQRTIRQNDFKPAWDQFFNPEGKPVRKAVTIDDLKAKMDQMDAPHADLVHFLFMSNYIDYSPYRFRDSWMIDRYVETYNAYFRESPTYLHAVNGYVLEILKEWQHDANHKYQKAKKDLLFWIDYSMIPFKPSMGDEIDTVWKEVCTSDDEAVIAEALQPYPLKIYEQVKSGQYEEAAANVYCILEYLATLRESHEDWFDSLWVGGEQTEVVNLVEVLQEVYCHLRQKDDLPKRLKNEMDIHLEIFNKKTSFFGIDYGDSRYEDMLLDGKKQYGDYSDLSQSDFWTEWCLTKCN